MQKSFYCFDRFYLPVDIANANFTLVFFLSNKFLRTILQIIGKKKRTKVILSEEKASLHRKRNIQGTKRC